MKFVFDEVYSLDQRCYDEFLLNEDILMENAAKAIGDLIYKKIKKGNSVLIVSGPGNNGADGVTLARILHKDYDIHLYLPARAKSKMCKVQLQRAEKIGVKIVKNSKKCDVVVDALFGSGLNRALSDEFTAIIKKMNKLKGYKIACDIPSGIDINGNISQIAFKADVTISMGAYKTPLFNDSAKEFTGDIKVANLGISREIYEKKSDTYLLETDDLKLPLRVNKTSNKGNYGHTVFLCGNKQGASIIASKAAFAFGSGLCTIVADRYIQAPYEIMQSNFLPTNTTSVCMGMGLGKEYDKELVYDIIENKNIPLVVDADLFSDKTVVEILNKRKNIVLTPHPKEFASLLKLLDLEDIDSKDVQKRRFELVRKFTKKYKDIVLLLKGSNTLIAQNEKVYINTYGTNSLSKGGSGDVLSGLIGSLLSQKYELLDATISASLAHSLSAKNYKKANYSLTPDDITEGIKCL